MINIEKIENEDGTFTVQTFTSEYSGGMFDPFSRVEGSEEIIASGVTAEYAEILRRAWHKVNTSVFSENAYFAKDRINQLGRFVDNNFHVEGADFSEIVF